MWTRADRALAILILYLACMVWITWPLATHLATHRPNTNRIASFDTVFSAWMLAWETHALATNPLHLADANIYSPASRTLFYGQTGFGALPFFAPVYLLTGNPTLALNVMFLLCCALTATAIHFVVVRWTGSHLAGLVGGLALLTDRGVSQVLSLAPHYAAVPYLPLIVYLVAQPRGGWAAVFGLAALIALQSLTDPVYFAPAVLAPLLLLAGVRLRRCETRAAAWRLLAAMGVALLALAPLYAEYLQVRAENPALAEQTIWTVGRATKWELPLVLPWGLFMAATAIPLAALVLIVVGAAARVGWPESARERTTWRHATFWVVMGYVMSLPPAIGFLDVQHGVVLPYDEVARWVPFFETIRRGLGRLRIDATIGLSLLVGLGFAAIVRRLPARAQWGRVTIGVPVVLAASAVALMLAEYPHGVPVAALGRPPMAGAYPLAEMPSPSPQLVDALRRSSGSVVEVTGMGPTQQAEAMYRSTFHWRPLLNGYSSYWPVGFPERMALVQRLPDPEAVAQLRRDANLTAIVVPMWKLPAKDRERWMPAALSKRPDLHLAASDTTSCVFDVVDPDRASR